jgi:murein DD-endopeptidase MepM/ murein hydrolase activator NlpD
MNISALEQINSLQPSSKDPQSPEALRKAAMQFEAILLMQLTSALNSTGLSDDEDSLFGGDGGSDLAKKMFSEQLANTMSQAGGVGLADVIMRQFGAVPVKAEPTGGVKDLSKAVSSIRNAEESPIRRNNSRAPFIDRSAKAVPVDMASFRGNADDFEVISTFENEARSIGLEESQRNLILDGRVVNTTRARIVPNVAIADITASLSTDIPPNPAVKKAAPAVTKIARPEAPTSMVSSMTVSREDTMEGRREVAYQMPVSGRLSSGFGNRYHPIDKKTKFHSGLDLAVPTGTRVNAAAEGVVEFAGWNGGYGNLVVLRHPDGRQTRYGHLHKIMVSEGEKVSKGQQFAISGSTGKSTGPHLHFEVRENGQVVNPLKIMSNVLPKAAER